VPYEFKKLSAAQQNYLTLGLFQPLEILKTKWWSINMNFIVELLRTKKGHDTIIVVVKCL
jgi:hypothetical protein